MKPRKGDALLFFSLTTDAIPDPNSLHAGCPVIEGEKWSATKWIHVDSFDKIIGEGGNCTDMNGSCDRWAALGECTKNPEYMVGTPDLPGYCRRSCKVCWRLEVRVYASHDILLLFVSTQPWVQPLLGLSFASWIIFYMSVWVYPGCLLMLYCEPNQIKRIICIYAQILPARHVRVANTRLSVHFESLLQ